jgi:hypothetical protein
LAVFVVLFAVVFAIVFAGVVFVCPVCCGWQADNIMPSAKTAIDFQFIAESPF